MRTERPYNSAVGDMDECLHDLLKEPPCFFLCDTFRDTLSQCLPFDEFLLHDKKVYIVTRRKNRPFECTASLEIHWEGISVGGQTFRW